MRLHILSDLHTEMAPFRPASVEADLVVLAGDIDKGPRSVQRAVEWFPHTPVILVAGNHEYYGGASPKTLDEMRRAAEGTNVQLLDCDEAYVGGVRLLGATMWTDFAIFPDRDRNMELARHAMNDFHRIRVSPDYSRFRPSDALKLNRKTMTWLRSRLDEVYQGATVVVTHHAPSMRSCHPDYSADPLTSAFVIDAENLMGAERVALWIHGHTHHCVDYEINGTRVLSNQRGYPGELVPGFDQALVVHVEP